ncbi:MAG: GspE/PulE family protein [Verrucomicrobiota bacterium]
MTAELDLDLRKIRIAPAALSMVNDAIARRHKLLPVALRGDEEAPELIVAFRNHEGLTHEERLESVLAILESIEDRHGIGVIPYFVEDVETFDKIHRRIYPDRRTDTAIGSEVLLNELVSMALIQRASDIHIDSGEEGGSVGFRIDGKMKPIRKLAFRELEELTAVIKLQANLDIAERRTPMDGAITLDLAGEEISLRLATIPTLNGEHLTLRLLASSNTEDLLQLDNLCFCPQHLEVLKASLAEPGGIIVVSGPTGSGKTTTLYAALRHLRDLGGRHIISLEDPVEMPLAGVTQVKIDEDGERVTFHKALRSVLRHDPDVVLIGEIRDRETADIAVRASLTGHLVLSTLHTNDALGVVTRLLDLGVPEYLLASTLRLVMAQRLVRRPSPHGLSWTPATETERIYMGCKNDDEAPLPRPQGSEFDGGTGYTGRAAIYEIVPMNTRLRTMIAGRESEEALAKFAFGELGCHTLRTDGIAKAREGLTTLAEVRAVAGGI